eukprot:1033109-Alexandrium_andersonii.AAC.1
MATSDICFALQPDLQREKFVRFHVFRGQDLTPFQDLDFSETPSQETATEDNTSPPMVEPTDRTINFG